MTRDPRRRAADLLRRLSPERWPVPIDALPAGTCLVGGAVRDALLGRLQERPDLDLVVPGDAIALGRSLVERHGGSCVVLDRERSIARLVLRGWCLDLARCQGGSLAADLDRRDYTVNAIALPLRPSAGQSIRESDSEGESPESGPVLIDPHAGQADLAARRMAAIREQNLLDDPLRLLRGVRLATELEFGLTPATRAWIRAHHRRLGEVAGERVLTELERLAAAPTGADGLIEVHRLGLLQAWGVAAGASAEGAIPEQAQLRLAQLTPQQAQERGLWPEEVAAALPLARLAALLPGSVLERLHASRRLQQRCHGLRQGWQLLAEAGEAGLDGLSEPRRLALQRSLEADLPALLLFLPPAQARAALARWRDPDDPLFHPRAPLDGRRLQQELALAPGRRLGELIDHLSRERAFGRLPSHEEPPRAALAAARQWLAGGGSGAEAASERAKGVPWHG